MDRPRTATDRPDAFDKALGVENVADVGRMDEASFVPRADLLIFDEVAEWPPVRYLRPADFRWRYRIPLELAALVGAVRRAATRAGQRLIDAFESIGVYPEDDGTPPQDSSLT